MPNISVIIPIAPDETEHHALLEFFDNQNDPQIEVITASGNSRANAQNNGAKRAVGDFLWFIHADTKIQPVHIKKLKSALQKFPNKILTAFTKIFFINQIVKNAMHVYQQE